MNIKNKEKMQENIRNFSTENKERNLWRSLKENKDLQGVSKITNIKCDIEPKVNKNNQRPSIQIREEFTTPTFQLFLKEKNIVGKSFQKNFLLCKYDCQNSNFEIVQKTVIEGILPYFFFFLI